MKIFMTGITGFVGSHLAKTLVERGHEVSGLNHPSNILGAISPELLQGLKKVKIYYGDVNDLLTIESILKEVQPDVIVHLAAHTSVEYSFYRAQEVMKTNFLGVVNLADAARSAVPNLKKFIFAGSVEEYGNQKKYPVNEESPLMAASPYGVAKIAAEVYLIYLHSTYGFPCVIFRNTNSYGRKYNDYFVIEKVIVQMLQKKKKIKMGNPEPVRDFIYIDDEVNAYVEVIETDKNILGEVFIPATGVATSIKDLVEKIKELTEYEGEIEWKSISYRPCEIWKIEVDPTKIKKVLGWETKYTLEEGLKKTIEWWKNKVSEKTMIITMDQTPKGVPDGE